MTKRRIGANWALLLVSGVVSMIFVVPLVAQVDSPDPDALVREMSSFLRRPDGLKVDYRDELTERRFWIDEEVATLVRRGRKET